MTTKEQDLYQNPYESSKTSETVANSNKKKDYSNTIFYKIPSYESFRYLRRGAWNIISVAIVVVFLYFAMSAQALWPKKVENPGMLYAVGTLVIHNSYFIIINIFMMIIYKLKHPLIEQYKTFNEDWPWDGDYKAWREQLKSTFQILFINLFIVLPLLFVPSIITNDSIGSVEHEDLPSLTKLITDIAFYIICEDFFFYWAHRILHHKKIYPYIHKIHHRYRLVVGISTEYAHPLEFAFANIISSSSGFLILGKRTHVFTDWVWIIIRISETTDGHSGYEFPFSPWRLLPLSAGQEFHNHHHLAFDGNYGSFFTIWDRIFNTTNKAFLNFIEKKYQDTQNNEKTE